jgi:HYDIN/CFA65/VesB-like, Ig-like domain
MFQPKTPGTHSGTLNLSFPGVSAVETIPLTGSTAGTTGPVLSVPPSLDFGSVGLGSTVSKSVSIADTGQQPLTISAISIAGTNAADFTAAPGQCPTVATGASCSLQVSFHPSADVSENAQLSISDDASGSPQSVDLTGTGVAPAVWTAPATSTTATTTSGGIANYALSLTSDPSFSGNLTLTCTGVPQYATCTLTPSTLTITPGQTASVSVAVATTNPTTVSAEILAPLNRITLASAICLPLLGWRSHCLRKMAALVALTLIACVVFGCGGSSSVATPAAAISAQKTPAGTYTLQVAASNGTFTQTQKLTLVVQ